MLQLVGNLFYNNIKMNPATLFLGTLSLMTIMNSFDSSKTFSI